MIYYTSGEYQSQEWGDIVNFRYGDIETEYLKSKDLRLAEVIEKVGHIDRSVDTDLFSSVVHHIIGQQISTKAQQTIWSRSEERRVGKECGS